MADSKTTSNDPLVPVLDEMRKVVPSLTSHNVAGLRASGRLRMAKLGRSYFARQSAVRAVLAELHRETA